jgi:acyl transferase domain-containing protein
LDPARTGYVESHGTGTPAGDPLEAAALAKVFGPGRPSSQPLVVGSVKTNIGHLEGASGLAGLIKTVLMLENNLILPNVNFEKANPSIPLHDWKLKVPTTVQPWPTGVVRRASVCNYGYGGSNSHVVIDDAYGYLASHGLKGSCKATPSITADVSLTNDPHVPPPKDKRARIFVLSAFDEASGRAQAKRLASYLSERQSVNNQNLLGDLAFTLGQRRSILPYKTAVLASSVSQLIDAVGGDDTKYSKATKIPSLGFVFTGQGAQWHAMGRDLIAEYSVFRSSLVTASKYLKMFGASWSLLGTSSYTLFMRSKLTSSCRRTIDDS